MPYMTNPNRELVEDAALDYSPYVNARRCFVNDWLWFCDGKRLEDSWSCHPDSHFTSGYIAARDAPDD